MKKKKNPPHPFHWMRCMKHIDRMLKGGNTAHPDGRLHHLMYAIFDFKVDAATVKRCYYMSEDAEEFGK